MPTFKMQPTTGDASRIITSALGATGNASDRLGTNDLGKPVKLGGASRMVMCAAGNEIEGFLVATESFTVNAGYAIGSVQTSGRFEVEIVGATACNPGDYVVAGAVPAAGTKYTNGRPLVQAGAPTKFMWRVVEGGGAAGTTAIIERI